MAAEMSINMSNTDGVRVLIDKKLIAATVKKLAAVIREDYQDKNPLLVGVLKGSFIFLADLVRCMDFPLEVDFIRLASYGTGMESSGRISLVHDLVSDIRGRHVLVVEDVIDTGLTTAYLIDYLKLKGPASLKLVAFADKPSRRKTTVNIDYLGMTLPDKFIVGYGPDWNEKYRNLPDICYIEEKK